MHPVALPSDFARLPTHIQKAHIEILQLCEQNNLSCRCEQNGRDFVIVIGRGLSSAKYWLDTFDRVTFSQQA